MTQLEILYNGRCPICSAEIAQYRKQAARADAPVTFIDLHDATLAQWGLSEQQATRRFHARRDGQIISGFPAFLALWRELPGLRFLARVLSLPGLCQIAGFGYDYLAAPLLYWMHQRRQRRKAS
jgi:predicted DCC family thiol-disulfide oxidoreductase YuxK